jgi:predicted DNA-binding transcriptional regulator AlpA
MVVRPIQAAALLGIARQTLDQWRSEGRGPRPLRIGRRAVAYRLGEIRRFIRESQRDWPDSHHEGGA